MNIFQVIDSYQYEMESRYQEKSMLTNLFTEHKFIGWLGLFIVFFSIFAIFVFQFLEWESSENKILTIAEVNLVLINKLNFSIIRKRPDFLSEPISKLNG